MSHTQTTQHNDFRGTRYCLNPPTSRTDTQAFKKCGDAWPGPGEAGFWIMSIRWTWFYSPPLSVNTANSSDMLVVAKVVAESLTA